ncbi:MAG: class I SAM-dependent methyltransferase [Candidatus Obscuribacterales bacterium]|nr:class I SAM-dependent methyltransferase [Candidatus Obscuribacterales bacterium]
MNSLNSKTIADSAEQWLQYSDNTGYWASLDYLRDIFGPVHDVESLTGCYGAEIGSGAGRIVNMLLDAGASKVVAIEPSKWFALLCQNVRRRSNRVIPVHAEGEAIREYTDLDFICSIGILHHIADPDRIIRACVSALKPGGKVLIWVYGHEGNELYLAFSAPLRALTTKLPHWGLELLTLSLIPWLVAYKNLCKVFPLPMRSYMLNHIDRLDGLQIRQTIYDQLTPAYVKYYIREEAIALLQNNGLVNVQCHHRHSYSWTVVGEKPEKKKTTT